MHFVDVPRVGNQCPHQARSSFLVFPSYIFEESRYCKKLVLLLLEHEKHTVGDSKTSKYIDCCN